MELAKWQKIQYFAIYFAKYKIADEEIIPTARRNSITVDKGKTKQFVIDNVLSGAKVVYSSSNNKVAYVNSKGKWRQYSITIS